MPGRVEIDPARAPVEVPAALFNELCAHARESDPEECCGLVSGDDRVRFRHAHRCHNVMTALHHEDPVRWPRDGREAFHMDETEWLDVVQRCEKDGDRVTAVYHSHVGSGAYFSEMDQQFALEPGYPFPEADHIVLAVVDHRVVSSAIFRRDPDTGRHQGHALVPVEA